MNATRGTGALLLGVGLLMAVVVGAVAAGGVPQLGAVNLPLRLLGTMPPPALFAVVAALAAMPLLARRWPLAVGTFFVWLVIEDLVRKLAGNDLRVYFVKDLLFAVAVISLVQAARGGSPWRNATGSARWSLYALFGWAIVMAVPTAFDDIRLPLMGLRLDFMYAPLVVAGYLIGSHRERLRRWLTCLAALGGLASLVGIAQVVIGPNFLAPGVPVEGLPNLVLFRGTALSGFVFRPTGTFVDPGRFSSMAVVALGVALAAFLITRGWPQRIAGAAAASAFVANWMSGGRTGILAAATLVGLALVAVPFVVNRRALSRALLAGAVVASVLGTSAVLAPGLFQSRFDWYAGTLDPRSPQYELASRIENAGENTLRGIEIGGAIGTGTGRQSLGTQYLYEGRPRFATHAVEGGYAVVAVEWGVMGLILWVIWTVAWLRRQWRATWLSRGTDEAGAGLVIIGWMLFFMVFGFLQGFQSFQNYLANAYFWLFSGVVFALPVAAGRSGADPATVDR